MYGKLFSSCFTGSMVGAGATVFAVWAYVIANVQDSAVELNPTLLAAVIGANKAKIESAIAFLCSPDPVSRNPAEGGRRLVHEAAFQYCVVSHERYRAIHNREDQREYERERKREYRRKKTEASQTVSTGPEYPDVSGTCPGQTGTLVSESDSVSGSEETTKQEANTSQAALVVAIWNRITEGKLPSARLTPKRQRLINARLKEARCFEEFEQACVFLAQSDFHTGGNDRHWRAGLDFLLKDGKITELAEQAAAQTVPRGICNGTHAGYAGCPPGMKFFDAGETND
jgi:hypothetical protein